jgi:hypothetical protein
MAKQVRLIDKPKLFSSQVVRSAVNRAGTVQLQDLNRDRYTNAGSTSSFRYDNPGSGLKSTQEIPVDFSKFENHTFFSSAVIKTNVAFDKIINDYPFDGTAKDMEVFEDGLTGWENYVLGRFPTNAGYLHFKGSQTNYVNVKNSEGYLFPGTSKGNEGAGILDTTDSSFSIETFLYIPTEANSRQVVCQRLSNSSVGFNIGLDSSASPSQCGLIFHVADSQNVISASMTVPKGLFFQVCATYDARQGEGDLKLFYNTRLQASSSNSVDSLDMSAGIAPLIIGSGSTFQGWAPQQTLSASMDEFRFFNEIRTTDSQVKDLKSSISQEENMKLYFKFNEPSGSYGLEDILLDSSGNSLHSRIANYQDSLRTYPDGPGPLTNEIPAPILYPAFDLVANLNADLLLSASFYDAENPNLITKLVPPHYFLAGQSFQGLGSLEGSINDAYTSLSIPGTGILGQTQIMMSLLFVWSKFFDEMKIFIDSVSNTLSVDYDSENNAPDKMLPFIADYYGFTLPNIFSSANADQYIKGLNVNTDDIRAFAPLREVQSQIWRRILTNLQEITKTKGTKQSIRSIMLAAGIDPDSAFKIREYGGGSKASLSGLRQNRREVSAMLDMSGTIKSSESTSAQGFGSVNPYITSSYLTSSRTEMGSPYSVGSFASGYSNIPDDGILTRHSFTYEGIYSWKPSDHKFVTQSLARIEVTGSLKPSSQAGLVANLVAVSGSSGSINLLVNPIHAYSAEALKLTITGANIFDGDTWNISFGRSNNYAGSDYNYRYTNRYPEYFLRCAKQNFGKVIEYYTVSATASNEENPAWSVPGYYLPDSNALTYFSSYNTSSPFIVIGSQSIPDHASYLLNSSTDNLARETLFDGNVAKVRFWSKKLTDDEWREHVRNFKSFGVENPAVNFNFTDRISGSFERLRVDIDIDQPVTRSDSQGNIELFDYSQNTRDINGTASYYHFRGFNFAPVKEVIKPVEFNYSFLSPTFDLSQTDNKVRLRSLQSLSPDYPYAQTGPIYDVPTGENPEDDNRFSIEYSTVAALNEDIIRIFSSLDFFDNALGKPEVMFADNYSDLDQVREIYFNRLEGKMNLTQFFQVFKWFDSSFSDLFYQLLPRKTKFLGVNFVVESHVLERHKLAYMFDDIYLNDSTRTSIASSTDIYTADGTTVKY